jgi:hypothetical protein
LPLGARAGTDHLFMPRETPPLPPLGPILERLEAQLANTPGAGRLSREDVIVLAILAVEREATARWTGHAAACSMHERASWQRRCTCGLEDAEGTSFMLRRRLAPPTAPPRDLRRRQKGDGR